MTNFNTFPDDLRIGGKLSLFNQDDMKRALEKAAYELGQNPDFKPSFTQLANVCVASKQEDAEFVKKCTDHIAKDAMPFLGFCMWTFGVSVLYIMEHGWDKFIERVRQARAEEEKDPDGLETLFSLF